MENSKPDKYTFMMDGEKHYNEDEIIALFLQKGTLFTNTRRYLCMDGSEQPETIVVFLNCNDTFAWACADDECITEEEITELYEMYLVDSKWYDTKWACKKRNMQPQKPFADMMKEADAWDDMMEALPKNKFDKQEE